jgi:hypothetical protein
LFRTNEIFDEPDIRPGLTGFSLLQFIQWHNPLEFNHNQVFWHSSSSTATVDEHC